MSAEPQFTCTVEIQRIFYLFQFQEKCTISFSVAKWAKDVDILHERVWTQMGFKCLYGIFWHFCSDEVTLNTLDKYHCELLGLKVVSRRKLIVWDKQTVAPVATQISRTAVLAFRIISQMLILLSLWTYETYYRNCFMNYCFPYYYLWLFSCELPITAVHIPTIPPQMHLC